MHASRFVVLLLAALLSGSVSTGNAWGQCRNGGQSRQPASPGLQSQNLVPSSLLQQGQLRQSTFSQQGDALLSQINLQNALRMQDLGWLTLMQRQGRQRRLATASERDPDPPAVLPPSPPPADREETAAGLLRVASALVADAKSARQFGERAEANRLLDRAEDRLLHITKRYQGTQAAGSAARILNTLDR
jgi:hypothetical protein